MKDDRQNTEERLLNYAAAAIRIASDLPGTHAGKHVAHQMIRSGTAPLAHHGEAQGAESSSDFIHKMSIALKELRETHRWLKLLARVPLLKDLTATQSLIDESDQLERIFNKSIHTARRNRDN